MPVITSVLVFIVYYILDNSGTRMVKIDAWPIWFGCLLATALLTPIAVFITYKANNDSVVFNLDAYIDRMQRLLGIRSQRHIFSKEVIIEDPKYTEDARRLEVINEHINAYSAEHNLAKLPSPVKVFFKYQPDEEIAHIRQILEEVIEDLSNTRDKLILTEINRYPIVAAKAHTRPFERKWMNIASAIALPIGVFLYFRMVRFRFRLYRDIQLIRQTNDRIIGHIHRNLAQ